MIPDRAMYELTQGWLIHYHLWQFQGYTIMGRYYILPSRYFHRLHSSHHHNRLLSHHYLWYHYYYSSVVLLHTRWDLLLHFRPCLEFIPFVLCECWNKYVLGCRSYFLTLTPDTYILRSSRCYSKSIALAFCNTCTLSAKPWEIYCDYFLIACLHCSKYGVSSKRRIGTWYVWCTRTDGNIGKIPICSIRYLYRVAKHTCLIFGTTACPECTRPIRTHVMSRMRERIPREKSFFIKIMRKVKYVCK